MTGRDRHELVKSLAKRLHVDVCSYYRVEYPTGDKSYRTSPVNDSLESAYRELPEELQKELPEDPRELVLDSTWGLNPGAVGYRIPIGLGLVGRVARTGKIVALQNPDRHPDYHYVSGSGEERFLTFMGIPLRSKGQEVDGVLVVQTIAPHQFQMSEVLLLQAAGRELGELRHRAA